MSANEKEVKKSLDNPLLDILGADKPPVLFARYRRLQTPSPTNDKLEMLKVPIAEAPKKTISDDEIGVDVLMVHSTNSNEVIKVKGNI